MGVFSNLRGPKIGSTHEGLAVANASPPSSLRRKVSSFLPICVAIVVLVEIASMGRLDNASLLDTLTGFFAKSPSDKLSPTKPSGLKVGSGMERCEEWLEREDSVSYSRNFSKDHIFISGGDKVAFLLNWFLFIHESEWWSSFSEMLIVFNTMIFLVIFSHFDLIMLFWAYTKKFRLCLAVRWWMITVSDSVTDPFIMIKSLWASLLIYEQCFQEITRRGLLIRLTSKLIFWTPRQVRFASPIPIFRTLL